MSFQKAVGYERKNKNMEYERKNMEYKRDIMYGITVDLYTEENYFITTVRNDKIGKMLRNIKKFRNICFKYKNHCIDIDKKRKEYRKIEIKGVNPLQVYREMLKIM